MKKYFFLGFFLFLSIPGMSYAWGPGTHIFISYYLFKLIQINSFSFLKFIVDNSIDFYYGSIAPDIFIGKGSSPKNNHCHNWQTAFELIETAETDSEKSFAYGYLSHLSADVIAHNYFIPKQLSNSLIGYNIIHGYWESRFDTELPKVLSKIAKIIIKQKYRKNDKLIRKVVKRKFAFRIRKYLFKRLLYFADNRSVKKIRKVEFIRKKSISKEYMDILMQVSIGVSFEAITQFKHGAKNIIFKYDPIGSESISDIKKKKFKTINPADVYIDNKLVNFKINNKLFVELYEEFHEEFENHINSIINKNN